MNFALKSFLFLIILALPLHSIYGQNVSDESTNRNSQTKEYYSNGKIKSITKTKIKYPRNIDLFNFYKKTIVVQTVYDSILSNKITYVKRITKVGVGGKHCYEYFVKRIDYDQNGKRKKFEKGHCDKNRYKYILYVNGKKDFIHIERPRKKNR